MKRVLKWVGFAVAGVLGVVVLAAGAVYLMSQARMNRVYEVNPAPVVAAAPARFAAEEHASNGSATNGNGDEAGHLDGDAAPAASDPEAEILAWGQHVLETRGCHHCHGEDLGGGVFADAMPVMRIVASNLTSGGVGAVYSDVDYVRAIRHGLRPDGKPLKLMPSYEYYYLSDADVGAVIAYLRSLPAVTRQLPASEVGPVGRALLVTEKLPLLAAEMIDHEGPRPPAPPKGATVEYGEYLAKACTGCHGFTFSGGTIPVVPPEWPPALNITPDTDTGIGRWTREQFLAAVTEGKRPDGAMLQPQFMPWPDIARFEPDELEALWMYLQTVEAKPFGGR